VFVPRAVASDRVASDPVAADRAVGDAATSAVARVITLLETATRDASVGLVVGAALFVAMSIATLGVVILRRQRRLARDVREQSAELARATHALVDVVLRGTGDAAARETELSVSQGELGRQLDAVKRSVGELAGLAAGLGSLERALGSVKLRGIFGEAQLEALLADVLAPSQYARQVPTRPGSAERVDIAIKLRGVGGQVVLLPIDAKFPQEDFARLLDARERGDRDAAARAERALATRVRTEAKRIHERYVCPPHTTDFAVMFVPAESLYGELLRVPGVLDALFREARVALVGPASAAALLGALGMGLRAARVEEAAGELWRRMTELQAGMDRVIAQIARAHAQVTGASRALVHAESSARGVRERLALYAAPAADRAESDTGSACADR
jgi:DNA recombination protein RmuC